MSNVYVHFSLISFPARYSVVNLRLESHSLRFREVIILTLILNPACGNSEAFRAFLHEIPRTPCAKMGCICPFCVHLYRNAADFRVWGFHFGVPGLERKSGLNSDRKSIGSDSGPILLRSKSESLHSVSVNQFL